MKKDKKVKEGSDFIDKNTPRKIERSLDHPVTDMEAVEEAAGMKGLNLVVVGSSAGGLEALQEMLSNLPHLPHTAIVIAQHLSPVHKSMMVDILRRDSNLVVKEAIEGESLQAGYVYITPPDTDIEIINDTIHLSRPSSGIGPKPSVDRLFLSAANCYSEGLVAVILSGTGTDGAEGAAAIHHAGGYLVVQDPDTARFNGMPFAVVQQMIADEVVPPSAIGKVIRRLLILPKRAEHPQLTSDGAIAKVLAMISTHVDADFSNYKSATIRRRLQKRIAALKLESVEAYLKHLENNPAEATEMFGMLLIGVTSFFRDKEAFAALAEVIRDILARKNPRDDIRFWVPGCSTGEEAYSIAILLHQALGGNLSAYNIQIFASDIDEHAIMHARKGHYSASSLEFVNDEIRETYFNQLDGGGYELIKTIRSMVLFSRHDVTRNPPFLKLDLISCRNLLIYFDSRLQQQVLPIFHYALNQEGHLFLGRSETIGQFTDLFSVVDQRNKLFKRKRGGSLHAIQFNALKPLRTFTHKKPVRPSPKEMSLPDLVKETLYNSFDHPYVIINEEFDVQEVYGDVRLFLGLPQGTIQVNLLKLIHKDLMPAMRSVAAKAVKGRESAKSNIHRFELYGTNYYVRFIVKPLLYLPGSDELYMVIFELLDISNYMQPGTEAMDNEVMHSRLSELENELAVTKEHLQSYIEELETSNEELQSLNEELQSTNEEFQSTNEELETTNEELQAASEEMQVAYAALDAAKKELEQTETKLLENEVRINALLNNELQAFLLVDAEYVIQAYNKKAIEIFNTLSGREIKVGKSFIDFLEPSKLEGFIHDFRLALKGETFSLEKSFEDHQGQPRWYLMNFTPAIAESDKIISISVSLLDITEQKKIHAKLVTEERQMRAVFDATTAGICITDETGRFVSVNQEYCNIYGYSMEEMVGQPFTLVVPEADREVVQQAHDRFIEIGHEIPGEWDVVGRSGNPMRVRAGAQLLISPEGRRFKVTSVTDITEKRKIEKSLIESEMRYRQLFRHSPIPAFVVDADSQAIEEANDLAMNQYGLSQEQLAGTNMADIFVQEDACRFVKAIESVFVSETVPLKLPGIWHHQKDNGDIITVEISIYKSHYLGRDFLVVLANDITPIIESQQQTNKVLEERNALLESIADGFLAFDNAGVINYWNAAASRLIGVTKEEALGKNFFELAEKGGFAGALATVKHALLNKGSGHDEFFHSRIGKWLDMNVYTSANRVAVYFRDITEHKKQVEATRLSNERFEWVTEATNETIWDYDFTTGKVFLNKAYGELYGHPDGHDIEASYQFWANAIHPEDRERVLKQSQMAIDDPQSFNLVNEYRMKMANGSYAYVFDRNIILRDQNGKAMRLVGAKQDLTSQKQNEATLKALNSDLHKKAAELVRSNQELEQFAYVASHDLQEPVRMIISFLGRLEKLYFHQLDEKGLQYMRFVSDGARKVRQIIMDLLEYSRVGRVDANIEAVNLNEVLDEVKMLQRANLEATKAVIHADHLPVISGNKTRMLQVFQNLVGNAIKYQRSGVTPVIDIVTEPKNGMWQIAIHDNGIGIAKEYHERIFELFQRLHAAEEYTGTGIGLAITKKIIESMGGSITLESEEGVGSTFFLQLPAVPENRIDLVTKQN